MKEYTYLVEVIYDEVIVIGNGTPEARREVNIQSQVFSFTDDNQQAARQAAEKEMDRIIRYGLKLHGGSVIKTVILPGSVRQVGLVDYNLYLEEQRLIQAETPAPPES